MGKYIGSIIAGLSALLIAMPTGAEAGDNGTPQERKDILTEVALEHGVPPEIVKAIAYKETGMRQFDSNGETIMNENDDGGIGMMQVTLDQSEMDNYDMERLKTDIRYNVEVGVEILLDKWSYQNHGLTPKIGEGDPRYLESWYFAILAYNGLSRLNDPQVVERTYQDDVYNYINSSRYGVSTNHLRAFAVEYSEGSTTMRFPPEARQIDAPKQVFTESTQMLEAGDRAYTKTDASLRGDPSTTNPRTGVVPAFTPVEIVSGPYHDNSIENHFVFYEIKSVGGQYEGYLASSTITPGEISVFTDRGTDPERIEAIAKLEARGTTNGYPDGSFGVNRNLQRQHAAVFLVRELDLTLPPGYEAKSKDIPHHSMLIAEAHEIFTPNAEGSIRPNDSLTRAQMAVVLNRVFNDLLEKPTTSHRFSDVNEDFWAYDEINTLYANGLTNQNTYRPNEPVSRGQFALFLNRIEGMLIEQWRNQEEK
ncbi:S-layer homology domain-containing protein [Halalkalibacterium ligniniphilum]|uniref:S-layer homology domain-containing protein n=1 Tax=Halalkalibacterium ligniniphilum TaxID=1134413 RepID=UPI00034C7581|nr:S-layer homology domain-containing protein [Halalkalibacterium ligniniphilum]